MKPLTGGGGTGIVLAGAGIDVITCGGGMLTTCTGGVCTAKPPNPRRPLGGGPGGSGGVATGGGGVGICKKSKNELHSEDFKECDEFQKLEAQEILVRSLYLIVSIQSKSFSITQ